MDLDVGLVRLQDLTVGVGDDEVDAPDTRLDHGVDGVSTATAHAHDLDDGPFMAV